MNSIAESSPEKKTKKSTKGTKIVKAKTESKTESKTETKKELEEEKPVIEETNAIEEKIVIDEIKNDDTEELAVSEKSDTEKSDTQVSNEDVLAILTNMYEINASYIKIDLKKCHLSKDFVTQISKLTNKITKQNMQIQVDLTDFYLKQISPVLKHNDSKVNKVKKEVNKENCAINKEKPTYQEVLTFMKCNEETKCVSRGQIIQHINAFVKKEKTSNNPDIFVEGDNTKFVLIGELKIFFEFIKKQMLERGDIQTPEEFPKTLSYKEIMKYLKYCFPEVKK